jgi:hypothetical protein
MREVGASGYEKPREEGSQGGRAGLAAGHSVRHWYSLQFSSSLPSGQSSKPLQRKRPMMQWMPLAQGKNVGPHFDLALAVGREGKTARHQEGKLSGHCFLTLLTLHVQMCPFRLPLKPLTDTQLAGHPQIAPSMKGIVMLLLHKPPKRPDTAPTQARAPSKCRTRA